MAISRARMSMATSCCSACNASHGHLSSRSRSKRLGWFSRTVTLLLSRHACCGRKAVEESVGDGTCVKQVLYGSQRCCGMQRENLTRLSYRCKVCPVGGDHRLTAIGQDQDEIQWSVAMYCPQNLERSCFKRMATSDNRDPLGKVLMMGSVSWLPSITSTKRG